MFYTCQHIQIHYISKNYEDMMQYYPELVENAIELKLYSRNLLAASKKQFFVPIPELERISHASQYVL